MYILVVIYNMARGGLSATQARGTRRPSSAPLGKTARTIVAIFYPFSPFCEIDISLLSLQTQPNTAQIYFRGG